MIDRLFVVVDESGVVVHQAPHYRVRVGLNFGYNFWTRYFFFVVTTIPDVPWSVYRIPQAQDALLLRRMLFHLQVCPKTVDAYVRIGRMTVSKSASLCLMFSQQWVSSSVVNFLHSGVDDVKLTFSWMITRSFWSIDLVCLRRRCPLLVEIVFFFCFAPVKLGEFIAVFQSHQTSMSSVISCSFLTWYLFWKE